MLNLYTYIVGDRRGREQAIGSSHLLEHVLRGKTSIISFLVGEWIGYACLHMQVRFETRKGFWGLFVGLISATEG